jgi:hypothetical protein
MAQTTASALFARHRQELRHLSIIGRPSQTCEMGTEDDCDRIAAFYLNAPASYVKPMLLCAAHAEDESFYFGTPIPGR